MELDDTFLIRGATPPAARAGVVRLAAVEPRSFVAGPGERAVVWVAGCRRRCPGCMKPDLFDFSAGRDATVAEVADAVLAAHANRPLDGLTLSGGEPFEQPVALAELAEAVRAAAGLNVLIYSGYRLDALRAEARFAPLLAAADVVIDGEYRQDRPGPMRWRGSDNQTVCGVSAVGDALAGVDAAPVREVQVSLTSGGLRLSGFPSRAVQRQLARSLAGRGLVLRRSADHVEGPR